MHEQAEGLFHGGMNQGGGGAEISPLSAWDGGMEVLFEADGRLVDVLARFKKEFLTELQEKDLQKVVILRILKKGNGDGDDPMLVESEADGWLKEQLLHVVEES